jgi:hypothetical protein
MARNTLKLSIRRRGQIVLPSRDVAKESVSIRRIRSISGPKFRRALFNSSIAQAIKTRGIAYDDDAKDFLDNVEMKKVLSSAKKMLKRKIDILGMDACMMSMAEVGYQLRDSVSLAVGSEEVEPGDGWPYDRILGKLAKKPEMMPRELASTIVDEYLASYQADEGVTQSACDLGKCGDLAAAVDQLADGLNGHLSDASVRAKIVECRLQAQEYDVSDYIDLYDFCDLLEKKTGLGDIQAACSEVKSAVRDCFVIRSGFKGEKVKHSKGLSIYFPQKKLSLLYGTLDFTKFTSWGKFLEEYRSHTQRRIEDINPGR